jgi:hypothetical protein
MLNRRHAKGIVSLPDRLQAELWPAFANVFAPEEVYFATLLAILGYLRPNGETDEVRRISVTHAEWERATDARPVTFPTLDITLLNRLRGTGGLFARKFTAESVPVNLWTQLVLGTQRTETSKRKSTEIESGDTADTASNVEDENIESKAAPRQRARCADV